MTQNSLPNLAKNLFRNLQVFSYSYQYYFINTSKFIHDLLTLLHYNMINKNNIYLLAGGTRKSSIRFPVRFSIDIVNFIESTAAANVRSTVQLFWLYGISKASL